MITISYTTDLTNHFKASRQIFHKTLASKIFYAVFIGLPLWVFVFSLTAGSGVTALAFGVIPVWLIVFIMLAYPLILMPIVQYSSVKRTFLASSVAGKTQYFEFSEKGVRNFGEGHDTTLPWSKVIRVTPSKNFLLLFISNSQAYYLPREKISAEEQEQIFNLWRQGHTSDSTS